MDVVYKLQRATVRDVVTRLAYDPSYSTVRAQLSILEQKGHLRHEFDGLRYTYLPTLPIEVVRRNALRHVVKTFFDGSAEKVVAALLKGEIVAVSDEELDRIMRLLSHNRPYTYR